MPGGPFRRPGGHCSQKLLLRRGSHSSPGCSRSSHQYEISKGRMPAASWEPSPESCTQILVDLGNRYGRQGGSNSVYTSLSGALVAAGRKSESQRSFRTHLKSVSNPTPNLGPSRNSLGQGPTAGNKVSEVWRLAYDRYAVTGRDLHGTVVLTKKLGL